MRCWFPAVPGYTFGVPFELHLAPQPSAPATARHVLATWLHALGVTDSDAEDLLIVLSELVTEGVSHEGGGDIVVRAFVLADHHFAIEVESTPWPEGVAVLRQERSADREPTPGRMGVVAAMADDVAVEHNGAGHTIVTVTVKVA